MKPSATRALAGAWLRRPPGGLPRRWIHAGGSGRSPTGGPGFTVIEVLAALTLFAIVSAGLVAASVSAVRYNRTSGNYSAATALAQDLMERVRGLNPANTPSAWPNVATPGTYTDPNSPINALAQPNWASHAIGIFTRRLIVTADSPMAGINTVQVQVSWSDAGVTRSVQLWSYVCQRPGCS